MALEQDGTLLNVPTTQCEHHPQQAAQPQQPQPQQPPPGRKQTYKSCDFCAKRKRKCDGGLPRCSLCIEKNQPYCHYQLKPPTKPRAARLATVARRRPVSSIGHLGGVGAAKRLQIEGPGAYGYGDAGGRVGVGRAATVAAADERLHSVAMMGSRPVSLKRCRLSPSPATGLVGMRENSFLGDFFGCLGILPLATESIVRDAMVQVMTEAVAPPPLPAPRQSLFGDDEHDFQESSGSLAIGWKGETRFGEAGEGATGRAFENGGGSWGSGGEGGQGSGRRDAEPKKCVMWCAIALGALVRGCPTENVAEYVRLAREALAECFDGNSVENTRAYMIMSFLHSMMHDEEKSQQYLSFAGNIVLRLSPDTVPKELRSMVLTKENSRVVRLCHDIADEDSLRAFARDTEELPSVAQVLEKGDLCNLFLAADRRLSQAFFTDMISQGACNVDADEEEGEGEQFVEGMLEQGTRVGLTDGEEELTWGHNRWTNTKLFAGRPQKGKPAPAGAAVNQHIEDVLPKLERLAKALESSDSTSGVGGIFFHGNVAYMKAVKGDMDSSYESLVACTNVILRYPGIVRFRTHLVHCILAASHMYERSVYDKIRAIYNSILPNACKPVPPHEEWTGLAGLCDHIFCRSVQASVVALQNADRRVETPSAAAAAACCRREAASSCSPASVSPSFSSLNAVSVSPSPPRASWTTAVGENRSDGGGGGDWDNGSVSLRADPEHARGASPVQPMGGVMLVATDAVIAPGPPAFPQVVQQNDSGALATPADRGGADDGRLRYSPELVATAAFVAEPATLAVDVRETSGPHPAAAPAAGRDIPPLTEPGPSKPDFLVLEGGFGSEPEDLSLTDADLLDVAEALLGEESLLDEKLRGTES